MEYKTIAEWEKAYLPKDVEQRLINSMSPEELGRYEAEKILRKIRQS